jgi:hypothetical protein
MEGIHGVVMGEAVAMIILDYIEQGSKIESHDASQWSITRERTGGLQHLLKTMMHAAPRLAGTRL